MIVIADYGMGNVGSVQRMLKKIGVESKLGKNAEELESATALILPGVGAFDHAIDRLATVDMRSTLDRLVQQEQVPVLGICLGMQLLFDRSEEGKLPGLAWLPGEVKRFQIPSDKRLPIPNMGWREVRPQSSSGLFFDADETPRFYFVHSYHVVPADQEMIVGTAHYGYDFCCAVRWNNVFGVQFHPEKSHKYGMRLLSQWVDTVTSIVR